MPNALCFMFAKRKTSRRCDSVKSVGPGPGRGTRSSAELSFRSCGPLRSSAFRRAVAPRTGMLYGVLTCSRVGLSVANIGRRVRRGVCINRRRCICGRRMVFYFSPACGGYARVAFLLSADLFCDRGRHFRGSARTGMGVYVQI